MIKEIPPRIEIGWFRSRYGQNFPDLLSDEMGDFLDSCIEDVYDLFHGVNTLWEHLDNHLYIKKTRLCFGLLVAWYIADLYPQYALGVAGSGGIPIKSKSIGGVTITYADIYKGDGSGLLNALRSNSFGMKAYLMLKTSGQINMFLRSY